QLGLDILSDMVLNPKLDPNELEKEKHVICEEIKMYMDQPAHRAFDILTHSMWPNHPLGRPITGYIDTVRSFRRKDLTDFTSRYYQPANISVAACGRIKRGKILAFTKKIFSMPSKKKKFSYAPVKKGHKGSAVRVFHKATEQTHVVFGFHSINRTHKLRYALALLNVILGGNMSSRLFDRLREKMALCYDISSSVKRYRETGVFTVHAGIDNDKLLAASEEIVREIRNIKENPVTADELYRAKEYARGQLRLVLEDTAQRMMWLAEKVVLEGRAPRIKEIFKNVEKVTAGDIQRAANIVFNKDNMNFATVGPARENVKKKLKGLLKV
ncbi:MAG: pitrilysin family protein, partial [Candidatus Omnitrophota bacterium]